MERREAARGAAIVSLGVGAAILLLAGTATAEDTEALVLTEVSAEPSFGFPAFVELQNHSRRTIELTGVKIGGGIAYSFGDLRVPPSEFVVLASDAESFASAYGFAPDGEFVGTLSSDGGRLVLRRGADVLRALEYPPARAFATNGGGASLELEAAIADPADPESWTTSRRYGGSPGRPNALAAQSPEPEDLVVRGTDWRYWKGTAPPPGPASAWTFAEYDDGDWATGSAPIGFGNRSEATVLEDMHGGYSTVYLRREFSFRERGVVLDAVLETLFDDGFVAFLNGVEVARRNLGAPGDAISHESTADGPQEAEGIPEELPLRGLEALLSRGDNVLAILAANQHVRSPDFGIDARLTITVGGSRAPAVPPLALNEISVGDADAARATVEIYHRGGDSIDPNGFEIRGGADTPPVRLRDDPGGELTGGAFLAVEIPTDWVGRTIAIVERETETIVDAISSNALRDASTRVAGRYPDGAGVVRALPHATPASPNARPEPGPVVISEIHYHPADDGDLEFVELFAREATQLGGWEISNAVRFEFPPGYEVEAGESVVVARTPDALAPIAGGRVTGPYRGRLSNDAEVVVLRDAGGREIDRVAYSDRAPWPRLPDGAGPSLERIDVERSALSAAAWAASTETGGSPGARNSVAAEPDRPRIELLWHEPVVPRPGEPIQFRAVASSEAPAELLWRFDGEEEFRTLPLAPRGSVLEAIFDGIPDRARIEYAARMAGGETSFPRESPGTFLLEVDDRGDSILVDTYRIVLRERDRLDMLLQLEDKIRRPAGFVGGGESFQSAEVRLRGNGSLFFGLKSYQVTLPSREGGVSASRLLFNAFQSERQVLGMDVWRRAGMVYSKARIVRLFVGGTFHPQYARMEPVDEAWLTRHFGADGPDGNLYRGLRTADFSYLGEDPAAYAPLYEKQTNVAEGDWSDIVTLTRTFHRSTDDEFPAAIAALIDVDQWLRWFAIQDVLSNQEGGLHRDTGDDYFIYRPPGGRFILVPWDMDSTFLLPHQPIFRPSIPAVRRLIAHPSFVRRYWAALEEALDLIDPAAISDQVGLLVPAVPAKLIDDLVTFALDRSEFVARSIPRRLTITPSDAGDDPPPVWYGRGELYTLDHWVSLSGRAPAAATATVTVNGEPCDYDPVIARWSKRVRVPYGSRDFIVAAIGDDGTELDVLHARVTLVDPERVVSSVGLGETTWTASGSPYLLAPSLEIPVGASVTAEAGADIVLPRADIVVAGELVLAGAAEAPVRLIGDGLAGSFVFGEGSRGVLTHVSADVSTGDPPGNIDRDAELIRPPLLAAENAELTVRHSSFRDVARVVVDAKGGALTVENCVFQSTGEAVHATSARVICRANVMVDILGNADGIDLDGGPPDGAIARIENNSIRGGTDDGIDLFGVNASVVGNRIIDVADRGISIEGDGSVFVSRNVVARCRDGIALKDGAEVDGAHNTVTACSTGIRAFVKNRGAAPARGTFHSSIIWGNERDLSADSTSSVSLSHCDVSFDAAAAVGIDPGESSIDADPQFAGEDDWRLRSTSPCLGAARDGGDIGAFGAAGPTEPRIDELTPIGGPPGRPALVQIRGRGFAGLRSIHLDGRPIARWRVLSDELVEARFPAWETIERVDVLATTEVGTALAPDAFYYGRELLFGDANFDGRVDIGDAIALLDHLFRGAELSSCEAAADLDRDGSIGFDDVQRLLAFLFSGGAPPDRLHIDCEPHQ